MIGAIIWLVSSFRASRAARKKNITLGRAVLAWKRERYDLNPAMCARQRIPKIARPS